MEQRGPAAQDSIVNTRGRGEMTTAPINLQDLRRWIYVKAKTESSWCFQRRGFGWKWWSRRLLYEDRRSLQRVPRLVQALDESGPSMIGPITVDEKCAGARSAGNLHAACEVAGAGDGATDIPTRARRGKPRTQTRDALRATAPVLDPTNPFHLISG